MTSNDHDGSRSRALRPPLTVEADPPLLRTPRLALMSLLWGLARGLTGAAATGTVITVLALFGLMFWSLSVSMVMVAVVFAAMFATGAYRRWLHRERDPGATVAADGISLRRDDHTAFYRWSQIHSVDANNRALVLGLDGGYAYRVPFRTQRGLMRLVERIERERQAYRERARRPRRDPQDVPQLGDEARWVARQRGRLGSEYRSGYHSVDDLCGEVLDVDAPLYQRFGAALALAASDDPRACEAVQRAHDLSASEALRGALTDLQQGCSEEVAAGWLEHLEPPHRRQIVPVGAPAQPRIQIEPVPMRIEQLDQLAQEQALAEVEQDLEQEIEPQLGGISRP